MANPRIKKISMNVSKVTAEVYVGSDEDNFGKSVTMTVEISRKNAEVQDALDALGVVLLRHADGALRRAKQSKARDLTP
jgi:hypothetical protein